MRLPRVRATGFYTAGHKFFNVPHSATHTRTNDQRAFLFFPCLFFPRILL